MLLKWLKGFQKYEHSTVIINGRRFDAQIADTFVKKALGLMYRKSIGKSECMLFLFGSDDYHGIWMRNMRFAIDVLWLDRQMRVVDMKSDLRPFQTDYSVFKPSQRAFYVIELPQGGIKTTKIKKREKIKIEKRGR